MSNTHTPASLLALAREALDLAKYRDRAERESPLPDGNNPRLAAWLAQDRLDQAIRDPALIVALVERLRNAAGRSPSFEEYAMTTPLTPEAHP